MPFLCEFMSHMRLCRDELYEYSRLVSVVLENCILNFSIIMYVYTIYFTFQYLVLLRIVSISIVIF